MAGKSWSRSASAIRSRKRGSNSFEGASTSGVTVTRQGGACWLQSIAMRAPAPSSTELSGWRRSTVKVTRDGTTDGAFGSTVTRPTVNLISASIAPISAWSAAAVRAKAATHRAAPGEVGLFGEPVGPEQGVPSLHRVIVRAV